MRFYGRHHSITQSDLVHLLITIVRGGNVAVRIMGFAHCDLSLMP